NDARAALAGEVTPDPLDADEKPLFEVDEQVDVDERPEEPGKAALQRPPAEVEDCGIAADHGGIAAVVETERGGLFPLQDLVPQRVAEIFTLLLCHLR